MSAGGTDVSRMIADRVLTNAAILGALAFYLFYLIPFTVPSLSFSPHVLAVVIGFLLVLARIPSTVHGHEFVFPLFFLGIVLLSLLSAPAPPVAEIGRAWLISLMSFWLFRCTFRMLPRSSLDASLQAILVLWSAACIAQVLFGEVAYVSSWFGLYPNVVYATGMSNFSNHGAILLVPLLVWTLVINLDRPNWGRAIIWMMGCAALYFTMSRAGWLGFFIAMSVLALRLAVNSKKMRSLGVHGALAIVAAVIAWAMPTRIDSFEPGGNRAAGRWTLDDYSAATRIVTLQVAAKAVTQHPLTGIGLGRYPEYYASHHAEYLTDAAITPRVNLTPHNGYAQFVAEVGVPAFLVLLQWWVSLLRAAARSSDPAALAISTSILAIAAFLFFHDGLYDRLMWILLGCAASFGHDRMVARSSS